MDWYSVESRAYQDDLGRSMNYNNMAPTHMMSHLHIPRMDGPEYPYVRSWDERLPLFLENYIKGTNSRDIKLLRELLVTYL